ncbi:hypothetical protein HELRODRAFT_156472 [Helobdella robusta]|uniref:26S proteasome non-ATPase regulatory subunit 13 n=1 Tax=Helobdella robusta TaxID=6412 RepID=T1ELX3_HELRO|nr:hypothetical protein HELRODRAFT_156472 [Helobdella robusta]ESO09500.1 hypothetical protein HELRODRAFT_156472 [Helobdella robusta]
MASRNIAGYFRDQQKKCQDHADLCQEWSLLEELYNKKLWHQLTLRVLQFSKHPYFSENDNLIQFYQNFIIDFEHRINPLALMEIVIGVVKQMKDFQEALKFLEKIKENIKSSEEALILCLTAIGNIYLQLNNLDETKKIIKEADKKVNDLDGVTPVHQRFYELSSSYYKLTVDYASYYRDSLRYLGCVDIKDIPNHELLDRAFSLCLAAILGKNVYNFGELLAHPVLNCLQNTNQKWLMDLLYAFNSGDLNKFYELQPLWKQQKDLETNVSSMLQKIMLLCLMEMTFKRPANHRQLTFEEISKETKKPIEEVELLVMKALSLKLVEGLIDGVEQKVHMSWVQPRVLDKQQITGLQDRMKTWFQEVNVMETLVEQQAQEILT